MSKFVLPDLVKNSLQVYCNRNLQIYEYQISSEISIADYLQALTDYFNENDNVCLIAANNLVYLKKELKTKSSSFKIGNPYSQDIEICLRFRRKILMKHCTKFLNTLFFNKIVDHLNDVGDPDLSSFNISQLYNSSLTQGVWNGKVKLVIPNATGISVLLDVSHQLTCQLSLFDFIRRELIDYKGHADFLEDYVKDKFIGKTVMTRYNNKMYRIDDIDFSTTPLSSYIAEDEDNLISFAEYYQNKYNIQVRNVNQPMLVNRINIRQSRTDQIVTLVHCLIPEFCYPVYNEWNPLSTDAFDEFVECVKSSSKVKEILADWDLSLIQIPQNTYKRLSLTQSPKQASNSRAPRKWDWWSKMSLN